MGLTVLPAARSSTPPISSAASAPQLSVVIPLYNCLALAQQMLASLHATLPAGVTHEIILVDDGSTDGTREWAQTLPAPCVVLLNERNLGYAKTNNRGAAVARGEFLALLNDDLVLLPGWLPPMLRALQRHRRAGIVGNVQLDARSGAVDHAGIIVNLQGKPEHARTLPPAWSRALAPLRRRPAVTGACLLLRRSLWLQLGGFDEGFVNGGEDVDLCYRARAAGYETFVALNSIVRHHVSSSPGRKQRDEENSFRLLTRWRHEFLAEATRAWCRAWLPSAWARPVSHDFVFTTTALAHGLGLIRTPPPEAVAALQAAQAREFERWQRILGPAA
jgi:GT2 family glycosyltransferase